VPGLSSGIAGCAAVLAAVGALSFGLPAIDRAIPPQRVLPSTKPLAIGEGVTITPPAGTAIDARGTVPGINRVLLVTDGIDYRIQAFPYAGPLSALAADLRREVSGQRGPQAMGDEADVETRDGVAGRAAQYTDVDGHGGWYAAYLDSGVATYVVVTGATANLVRDGAEIRDSLATLRFGR